MKMKTANNNKAALLTKEGLRAEQRRLAAEIKQQELELRSRVQQLPGELFYAGANAVVPAVLTGKISQTLFSAGRTLVNRLVNGKSADKNNTALTMAKQAGLYTIAKMVFRTFMKRN